MTSFANSRAEAIIMTSIFAPPNNLESPVTEKKAAAPANASADNATKKGNIYLFMSEKYEIFLRKSNYFSPGSKSV